MRQETKFECTTFVHKVSGLKGKWSSVTVSPQANNTDRTAAAFRRSENQLLRYRDSHGRYSQLSRPQPLLFQASGSTFILTRLSGLRSSPTASQEI
jgi:hypothetical protein